MTFCSLKMDASVGKAINGTEAENVNHSPNNDHSVFQVAHLLSAAAETTVVNTFVKLSQVITRLQNQTVNNQSIIPTFREYKAVNAEA